MTTISHVSDTTVKPMTASAMISTMTQAIFNKGRMAPKQALMVASALIQLKGDLGVMDSEEWVEFMEDTMNDLSMTVDGAEVGPVGEVDGWVGSLVRANLVEKDDEGNLSAGSYLLQLEQPKEKAYPRPAAVGVAVRRKRLINAVPGMLEAVEILQDSQYNVDAPRVELAQAVYAKIGALPISSREKAVLAPEQFVIDGCLKLIKDGNVALVAEFFDCGRGRVYQGDGHGPNGQSSDMARSFMDLHGVDMGYDVEGAKALVLAEMEDMCKLHVTAIQGFVNKIAEMDTDTLAGKVVAILRNKRSPITKVWSFIKAAQILAKLNAGETPYIGMAFGLDAKCSGPQLAGLMTNDLHMAAACGFTSVDLNCPDAYEVALSNLDLSWEPLTRSGIKTPYMATFYGQSWQALTDISNFGGEKKSDLSMELLDVMIADIDLSKVEDSELAEQMLSKIWDQRAKELVLAIEKSYGKIKQLRDAIKAVHGTWVDGPEGEKVWVAHTNRATSHTMPDGVVVRMNYKLMVDIEGETQAYGSTAPDVSIVVDGEMMKFDKMVFKTNQVDLARYGRNGFVNLIQATDAQLARLIIRYLNSLGAQHVIAVHDCFRVNINDMLDGKLIEAIKHAYMTLFGTRYNETDVLSHGTDIMGMYFQGVNRARINPMSKISSQFATKSGVRSLSRRLDMPKLIDQLGEEGGTYFFAK